ncbi:hypothetical protein FisN_23Lu072 [Fistulifera solaris]|uniref:Uncharacterized protein n=1 Tax=Fistulifera solaris TaxID=1519565 RepID=A0A1Z5KKS2_FISSO|nr:hypothetical protein FisN_23Lu072 [Fistulifera solaris]|eukprot:GAX26528.1 hypothetical protein FisN_23Lu072 [Fistulifera solaris]
MKTNGIRCLTSFFLWTTAVVSTGLFERQLQVTCSVPSRSNGESPDNKDVETKDCSKRLSNVQGYCRDGAGKEFDYCYGTATERLCRELAEASKAAVGWSRNAEGYCEIYFDEKDSKNQPASLCPSKLAPNDGLNTGVGFPREGDGNVGVFCYTCQKIPKKCNTKIEETGYCLSANGAKYDYCFGNLLAIECEAAATTSKAVGWASTTWGYCEVYFDNTQSQSTVAPLCPSNTSPGVSSKAGVGTPTSADGSAGVSCYACAYVI